MGELFKKIADELQEWTFKDVVVIAAIASIAIPVYLVYWSTQNPEPLIELISGERIVGTVGDCLLLEYKQQRKTRYRLLLNVERSEATEITIAAGSMERWNESEGIVICDRLIEIRDKIRQ